MLAGRKHRSGRGASRDSTIVAALIMALSVRRDAVLGVEVQKGLWG